MGFGELIEQHLRDSRANNARLPFADLLRQSVSSRLAGYEDVNDAGGRGVSDPLFPQCRAPLGSQRRDGGKFGGVVGGGQQRIAGACWRWA